jgi:hypothetical protein
MSQFRTAVQLVVDDQRQYSPGMSAVDAVEHVLKTVKLHRTHGADPMTRAYHVVLRHPKQARFDAKEIDRHEHDQQHHH